MKTEFSNPITGQELEQGLNNNFSELYDKTLTDRAISHTYIAPGDEIGVAITEEDTPTKYQLPVTAKKINNFGISDIGGGVLALTYTGSRNITCSINASSSVKTTTNNVEVIFHLYKNGTMVVGASIERKIGTGADLGAMALSSTFEAAPDDYFEIYVECDTATTLTLLRTSIVIAEL